MSAKLRRQSLNEPAIWRPYTAGQGFAYAYKVDGFSDVYPLIWHGKPLRKPFPRLVVDQLDSEKLPDVLGLPVSVIVLAPWLQDVLNELGRARIQYVPVRFKGSRSTDYQMAHVLEQVACVDRSKSKLAKHEGTEYEYVKKLRLTPLADDGPNIFRIAEFPRIVVVRPQLRQALEATSKSPGRFMSIDDYKEG